MRDTVDFAGIKVDNLSLNEAAARVEELLLSGKPQLIVTPNPEIIVAAQKDPELKNMINRASLRVPDGVSMVVVSRILGTPLKERVAGIDLMLRVIEISVQRGYRIFLLGSKPGIAERASKKLRGGYPGLNIIGTYHGYFKEEIEALERIKTAKPDILFVGMGGVRQEKWCNHHLKELNVGVCMVVGGSLDVISGSKKRAPKWIRALCIEWLYRLISEPGRWKRQLALPKFLYLTLLEK